MALTQPQSQETGLVGLIASFNVEEDGLSIKARFTDKKTGDPRVPQDNIQLFTLAKDTKRFEMIFADSHETTDGITTITINPNGRNLLKYGNLSGGPTGFRHTIGVEIGCADVHIPVEVINEIIRGNEATGSSNLRVGGETDSDITLYAQNADANKPFLRFDKINDRWVFSNDGIATQNMSDGTNLITAGDGIDITSSVVSAKGAVQVSNTDTNSNYLEDKLVAGTGVVITKKDTGADETLEIEADLLSGAIDGHYVYAPAYLTCGTSPTSNYLLWLGTTDGEFSFTLDGVSRDITGLDFTSATDMDGIAAVIQAGMRTITSGEELCVWDTDHFVITSGDTSDSSSITVLSVVGGGVGTDISGVSVGDPNMDGDVGVVTVKVINEDADAGKIVKTNSNGRISSVFFGVDIGGTGADGALDVSSGVTTLDTDKVYNFTTIDIAAGATLEFSGNGAAILNASDDVNIDGTVDLTGVAATRGGFKTSLFDSITQGSPVIETTPNTGGLGFDTAGDGGSSIVAGDGSGGAPGANGSGGGSVTGGGGGGGSSSVSGIAATGLDGGNGGDGTSGSNDHGGGGGGGYLTGDGGDGGGGSGNSSFPRSGGNGGNSGATGGNGGDGGNGGSMTSAQGGNGGSGGDGGDGYYNGGDGGTGGSTYEDNGGAGGDGGDGYVGDGGNGGTGGSGTSNLGTNGGRGGDGGIGVNGGDGGDGGDANYGGTGGDGGDATGGATCLAIYCAQNVTISATGVVIAQGNGGDGGATGTGRTTSDYGTGGNGGDGSDGADITILCNGICVNNGSILNTGGLGGAAGSGLTYGTDGLPGDNGNPGRTVIGNTIKV